MSLLSPIIGSSPLGQGNGTPPTIPQAPAEDPKSDTDQAAETETAGSSAEDPKRSEPSEASEAKPLSADPQSLVQAKMQLGELTAEQTEARARKLAEAEQVRQRTERLIENLVVVEVADLPETRGDDVVRPLDLSRPEAGTAEKRLDRSA